MAIHAVNTAQPILHTGTISGGRLGSGTYQSSETRSGNSTVTDTVTTYANGTSTQDIVDITKNADGTITRDSTNTNGNGKVTTLSETYSALSAASTRSITGTATTARGATAAITGTQYPKGSGVTTALHFTGSNGDTGGEDITSTKTGNVTNVQDAVLGYNGKKTVTDYVLTQTA